MQLRITTTDYNDDQAIREIMDGLLRPHFAEGALAAQDRDLSEENGQ